jgi:hypothetical protein
MSTITLNAIEAKQSELTEMIARFKAQQGVTMVIPEAYIELQAGEHYAGLLLAADGSRHHLILLAGEAESVDWEQAKVWAAEVGGELPTRSEQALLYANLKGKFQAAWYWSSEPAGDGSYAWHQLFDYGSQGNYRKSYEGRARAVRRVTA